MSASNQSKPNDIESHEMKYFMNRDESDITFLVEGIEIPANKWLLRMKSDVFEAMFSDHFSESNDKVIEIKDIKYKTFKAMIQFLYCNKLVLNDENDYLLAMDVFRCGDKYHSKQLMDCVEKKLIKMIGFENIEDMFELANNYKLKKLWHSLNEFLEHNVEHYLSKSMDELKRLNTLSDNHLMILLLKEKDIEINRLEFILSEVARRCMSCKNRITFSDI